MSARFAFALHCGHASRSASHFSMQLEAQKINQSWSTQRSTSSSPFPLAPPLQLWHVLFAKEMPALERCHPVFARVAPGFEAYGAGGPVIVRKIQLGHRRRPWRGLGLGFGDGEQDNCFLAASSMLISFFLSFFLSISLCVCVCLLGVLAPRQ